MDELFKKKRLKSIYFNFSLQGQARQNMANSFIQHISVARKFNIHKKRKTKILRKEHCSDIRVINNQYAQCIKENRSKTTQNIYSVHFN